MPTYKEKLLNPKWQKKRLEIFKRDKFACKLCGDTETTLNIHHKKYIYDKNPWGYKNSDLITLCQHCHNGVTDITKITNEKFDNIKTYKLMYSGGSRISFTISGLKLFMAIYKNDEFLNGYEIYSIEKLIKFLQNNG